MFWEEMLNHMEQMCGSCDGRGFLQEWVEIATLDDLFPKYLAIPDPAECPDCRGTGRLGGDVEEAFSPWPILGWRNYRVKDDGYGVPRFYGQYAPWLESWHEARCLSPNRSWHLGADVHYAPHWDCVCGIYLRKRFFTDWDIVTLCAAENVIEHEKGYRAARCWVLGVAPSYGNIAFREAVVPVLTDLIEEHWPGVEIFPSGYPLQDLYHRLIENPEEIPTWDERRENGHRQAPADNPPDEGSGPAPF